MNITTMEATRTTTSEIIADATLASLFAISAREKSENPQVPFPQADDLNKVVDLIRKVDLGIGHNSTEKLTAHFKFDTRQANYYANAAIFLGAVQKYSPGRYKTTYIGRAIAEAGSEAEAMTIVAEKLLSSPTFYDTCKYYLKYNVMPGKEEINQSILENQVGNDEVVGATTADRRTSTVRSWLQCLDETL